MIAQNSARWPRKCRGASDMAQASFKAILTRDGKRIVMARGAWRQTVGVDDLPGQLRLYRGLRDRNAPVDKRGKPAGHGPYHQIYAPNVEALEAVERKLKESRP